MTQVSGPVVEDRQIKKLNALYTGQISGFLAMPDFLQRFAVPAPNDSSATMTPSGPYKFSNVRSGLIVGLVSSYDMPSCLRAIC